MKINFLSQIPFNSLAFRKLNNLNFPQDFQCISNSNTVYDVSVGNNYGSYQVYFSDGIEREESNAELEIVLNKDEDYLYVDNMYTEDEFRGEGLGICMHLTNIIEMMENNFKGIELYSVASAIPFHSKLGFKPNDKWNYMPISNVQKLNPLQENLKCIIDDKTPELQEYSDVAKEILRSYMSPEDKAKISNKVIYNYIKKSLKIKSKEEQKTMFKYPIQMILTKKDIIKNKKFYNKLFNKYCIDYQIK